MLMVKVITFFLYKNVHEYYLKDTVHMADE